MRMRFRNPAVLLWIVLPFLAASPSWAQAGNEPARRLTPRGTDNLVAFTRLLGYVRFFHPSDQVAAANWDSVAIAGVQAAERATNPRDLAVTLEDFFQTVAPTLRVFPTGTRPDLPAELAPPSGVANPEITAWSHFGVGLNNGNNIYKSERTASRGAPPSGLPLPGEPLVVDLGGGVSAQIPLTLYKETQGNTIPRVSPDVQPPRPDKPEGFVPLGNDRATRLANMALSWTIFQHFYPYFDAIRVDWNAELRKGLAGAATAKDERAFVDVLRRLVAALQDGHGFVGHRSQPFSHQLPIVWDWIEGKLAVIHVGPDLAGSLGPGDVVLSINGRPARQVYAAEEKLVSGATPQWRRWSALEFLTLGAQNEAVRLQVRRASGKTVTVSARRTVPWGTFLETNRPEKVAEVRPGIFYLDVDRINDSDFRGVLDRLASARGIIFDFRGYPTNLSTIFYQHIATQPLRTAFFNVPLVTWPDRVGVRFEEGGWSVPPLTPRFQARVAFITDGRAISKAETYMGIVEHYRLGEIVGEATAGTNGNVNSFRLPGNYFVGWTGMQVVKHDGSRHHGVGIRPTVPVTARSRV
jgi:hypothetical protein